MSLSFQPWITGRRRVPSATSTGTPLGGLDDGNRARRDVTVGLSLPRSARYTKESRRHVVACCRIVCDTRRDTASAYPWRPWRSTYMRNTSRTRGRSRRCLVVLHAQFVVLDRIASFRVAVGPTEVEEVVEECEHVVGQMASVDAPHGKAPHVVQALQEAPTGDDPREHPRMLALRLRRDHVVQHGEHMEGVAGEHEEMPD